MIEIKYMVIATFSMENVKTEDAAALIGGITPFYCGNCEDEAREIYDQLPNGDKELITAKVTFTNVNNSKFIKTWIKLNNIS